MPSLPTVPRAVARFNVRVTNPLQGRFAGRLAPWAIIAHVGRRSGRRYLTPVLARVHGERITVPLPYGTDTDWIRNLQAAGEGELVRSGTVWRLVAITVDGRRLHGRIEGPTRPAGPDDRP